MSHCVPHTTRVRVDPKWREITPLERQHQRHPTTNALHATKQHDHDGRTSSNYPLPRVSIGLLPAGCIQ